MAREKINWLVEENDVKEFTKPTYIEIPIDKGQYNYILTNGLINNKETKIYLKLLEELMVDRLFTNEEYNKYKKYLKYDLSLSYIPNFKENNWYIGYSPIEIYNNIFKILGINERLNYIDYSNHKSIRSTQNKISMILNNKRKEKDIIKEELLFIEDAIKAIDNIFLLSTYDIEAKIKDNIIYKNLLYYLSVKSLDILDKTDDIRYGIIPRDYYLEVTTLGTAQYPNQLFMDDVVYSYNHYNYNQRMSEVLVRYPILLEEKIGMNEINIMNELDIIKADNFIEDVEKEYWDYVNTASKKKIYTKTDRELNILLNRKINFYKSLMEETNEKGEKIVVSTIKGKNSLNGYYGFVLSNNYVVLDKFFKIRLDNLKSMPAYDEAIYIMPIDLFIELNGSKKAIREYRKKNPNGNVEVRNHTKKYSYEDRIKEASRKEDVSAIKSDWFLEFYPEKKLILKESN